MHILRIGGLAFLLAAAALPASAQKLFPAAGATGVNPDTHLVMTFDSAPAIGASGVVRIYDAKDKSLVDTLDLSIPTSPNPSGRGPAQVAGQPPPKAAVVSDVYQETNVGGQNFHFRPIIVHGNVATLYPHNGALKYGRTYIVKMDASVLAPAAGSFAGVTSDTAWTFSTKAGGPMAGATRLTVAADGKGDFSTVQGAIAFVADRPAKRTTIFVRNGNYEEIVSLQNKANLVIRGENRDKVVVGYANNTPFNPQRRWAFSIINGEDIQLSNFTINNYAIGQAEALMTRGQRIILDHMTMNGSGDALTTYGTLYIADSKLTGHGDTVLGYAAAYWLRSEIHSIGPITWTRTPQGAHGNVFVDCRMYQIDRPLPWTVSEANPAGDKSRPVFARLPHNGAADKPANFPYAEMVLINTRTQGVPPDGWGPVEENGPLFDGSNVRFWEYNTMDMAGRPIDTSQRHKIAKVLTKEKDAAVIADYMRPEFVLGGWKPVVR